jgi:hypothetical protein
VGLIDVVSKILKRTVSEDEAKQFALDQFGVLMTYMTEKHYTIAWRQQGGVL